MKHVHEEDNSKGTPFTVCKRGHTVMNQRYCKVCGRIFCKQCQAGDRKVNQDVLVAAKDLREAGF